MPISEVYEELRQIALSDYGDIVVQVAIMRLMQMTVDDQLVRFELPPAVQARLQHLLDRQDQGLPLSEAERQEAEGLVEIAEFLSLLRLRAERVSQQTNGI
jgi:hypothetical protein